MKPAEKADPKAKPTVAAKRLKAKLDARPGAVPASRRVADHQHPTIATRG